MQFIKYMLSKFIRMLLHVFLVFPLQNTKVLFYPTNGKYYCNLKYISEYLFENKNIKIIWTIKDCNDKFLLQHLNIHFCKVHTISFFYHCITSKIIIFNNMLPSYLVKRKNQIYMQTWHGGGAYKKIDVVFKNVKSYFRKKRVSNILENIDYVISSCKKFTSVFKDDTRIINAEYLEIGLPRNDIFFDAEKMEKSKVKVNKNYDIDDCYKTVVYAPTLRYAKNYSTDIDTVLLLKNLEKKFGNKFFLLLRVHPHTHDKVFNTDTSNRCIDVSNYSDMQELLCTADILITDYSSCMWDYSFTYKPCFIFATDIETYKQEHDFHTPISEWPFPIATNNEELAENILRFDHDEYIKKVKKHHHDLGSFENGHATERVVKLINDICSGEMK